MKKLALLFCGLLLLSACGSYKKIPYYQDLNPQSSSQAINNYKPYIIRAKDILAISVMSRNPDAALVFNSNLSNIKGNTMISPDNPIIGFMVDDTGNIYLPYIGAVKVDGLTPDEARKKINEQLTSVYKDPVVNLRIANFKVAVYGDVLRPDVYSLQNEQTSITQLLSMAGDLNITAKRNNVLLIRNEGGERKFIRVDLTSKELFNSPYYYLRNNDEVYVQPDRTKYASVDRGYRNTSLLISALSMIAIMVTAIK